MKELYTVDLKTKILKKNVQQIIYKHDFFLAQFLKTMLPNKPFP